MKTTIEVENRKEAELIKLGLQDKEVRALVKVMGALSKLPTHRAKVRAMTYVADLFRGLSKPSIDYQTPTEKPNG